MSSSKPEIPEMVKIVNNVDWFGLGTELKLPQGKLNDIYESHRKPDRQRIAMLDLWLRCCIEASWILLAEALERMGETVPAAKVRKEYCGGIAAVRHVPPPSSAPMRDIPSDLVQQPAEEATDGGPGIITRTKNALEAFRKGPIDHTDGMTEQNVERFYKMEGRAKYGRHGIALIINNIKWEVDESGEPYMSDRYEAIAGATALNQSLEDIGYRVKVENNVKTGKEIMTKLEEALENVHPVDDSFICFISTHGDEDGVYGTFGRPRSRERKDNGELVEDEREPEYKPVSIENLSKLLEPDVCAVLKSKPKLFFIQACRGRKPSEPVDGSGIKEKPVPRLSAAPRGADFFFSYATDPENVSLRVDYPKYLSEELKKKLSLDEIVMKVHERLASRVADADVGKHLQIGQVVHTMRGPVYF